MFTRNVLIVCVLLVVVACGVGAGAIDIGGFYEVPDCDYIVTDSLGKPRCIKIKDEDYTNEPAVVDTEDSVVDAGVVEAVDAGQGNGCVHGHKGRDGKNKTCKSCKCKVRRKHHRLGVDL